MAFHSRSATTARKLWMRTTRAPGIDLMDDSSTELSVAPRAGGWMTRACSMEGRTRSWRDLWRPVILEGRSGRGGAREEGLPRGGRGVADLGPAAGDGVAACGGALVGRERGVTLDHGDAVEGNVELLARHLPERDAPAGADVDLAGEERDRAVRMHGEIRVHEIGRHGLAEEAVGVRHGLGEEPLRALEAQPHDEGAACSDEAPTGDHHAPPVPATLSTARITRAWLPQRQRLPASASRTCCSLGRGVLLRSARAATTRPAVQ